ncbi:hypothetical protein [Novosphingobium beihaiensis]|uniref:Uncharacterized protein n=1 Tax=Novosphingobium beihaiensis TaxID=2930389 RepID=A0ABT0BN46_9SPHN|nr:hypothetical protein [Novosphingobium beihaiensis]MCJ2186241.1 hypothetical protein [Novosphingobium beihaiensis]
MPNAPRTFSDHIAYAQEASAKARQSRVINTVALAFLGIVVAIIPALAGVEFTLAFSVMDMIFGAEVPSDPVPFQVYVLSGSAMVAVVALHVFIEKNPHHLAIRLIDKVAPYGLLLFFVGLIALYASSNFHGVDSGAAIPLSDAELFGDEPPLETGNGSPAPWLNTLIGLGLGALIIVNVSAIHRLITIVREKLPALLEERVRLNAILQHATLLLHRGKACIDARREIERRRATTPEDLALEAAADIEAAIAPTLRRLSAMIQKNTSNRPSSGGSRGNSNPGLPTNAPDPKDIETFIQTVGDLTDSLPTKLVKLFR